MKIKLDLESYEHILYFRNWEVIIEQILIYSKIELELKMKLKLKKFEVEVQSYF